MAEVGRAHGLEAWRAKKALRADLLIESRSRLEGELLLEVNTGRVRMALRDGTLLIFDGQNAWVSPASSTFQRARFHVLTWPYFLAAPMKLHDPGTKLAVLGPRELRGTSYQAARLTFQSGVGDTPDDWYLVYVDPRNHRLHALAYIVTYGQGAEEAAKDPHAITYDDSVTVDGVTLSTTWTLWHWSEDKGIHGDPIGKGKVANLEFVVPSPDAFSKPEDAHVDALPTAGK
ncbi:MAG: hypothetical protein HY652_09840 [Acidobacteria bacterium]|nr:hypothetical protein [Acidobacteriota bacterium]